MAQSRGADNDGRTPGLPVEAPAPTDAAWAIPPVDPETNEVLPTTEIERRERIRAEHEQGFFAVDAFYGEHRERIHQPLYREGGELADDVWEFRRAEGTAVRVPIADIWKLDRGDEDGEALERVVVDMVRRVVGELGADVMAILYKIANDPPNWRRPRFTVSLNTLLDLMGYPHDSRGLHTSDNRRQLSATLLALQYTHIGVTGQRGDGSTVGIYAPLLSALVYKTSQKVAGLHPAEVIKRGLPDEIGITINSVWYGDRDGGRAMIDGAYTLIPNASLPAARRAGHGSRRVAPADRLRAYIAGHQAVAGTVSSIVLPRSTLLEHAGIHDRNVTNATRTLTRACDRLRADAVITDYAPRPLPIEKLALVTLHLVPSAS